MRYLQLSAPTSACIARYIAFLIFAIFANAQSINISNFYYRDYLDFGQNKGVFKEGAESSNGLEITSKDGKKLKIPHIPNFYASSNNGSLTNVGRGFVVTANHVISAEQQESSAEIRKWGLTHYIIGQMISPTTQQDVQSHSDPYGRDEKFLRFNKYVVEGQVEMLDIDNSTKKNPVDTQKEKANIEAFNAKIKELADNDGKTYIFQAGLGVIELRGNTKTELNRRENGETKGGGFGYIRDNSAAYYDVVYCDQCQGLYGADYKDDTRGINFVYIPKNDNANGDFNNRITTGDSGSGIYAYDSKNNKWILVGVTSSATAGQNQANISAISNKDLLDFQSKFEQKINLVFTESATNTWELNNQKIENKSRGDTPKETHVLEKNKDLVFRGGGVIEVSSDITRIDKIQYDNITQRKYNTAGGFVFEGADSATNYTFKNKAGGNYTFKGSGLDIGENVSVEWHLKNPDKNESLHKVGKGTLVIKTQNDSSDNLGTLKVGEGKVVLDTDKKAYDGIYLTSGRGRLEIKQLEGLGATKSLARNGAQNTQNAESYTLSQNKNSEMGFYFGTGGGTLDLAGKSLVLNTIAANDRFAVVKSQNEATLEIQGLGYKDGTKENTKTNTIIHASIGDESSNINLKYSGSKSSAVSPTSRKVVILSVSEESLKNNQNRDSSVASLPQNDNMGAHLIFDGNINTKGKLEVKDGNVALQGHATAHATIGDNGLIEKIKAAEKGTRKEMPDYMDLSKPSTLKQPDWDRRTFKFGTGGIMLDNSTLTLGRDASLEANITASNNSKITFGAGGTHFIDNNDGKNITGSGFSYYQKVEQGNLTGEALKGASESVSYKGTISANGGEIKSSIFDFRANLDLKESAELTADYLTIEKSSSIKLASGTSASVKTLKLDKISSSDLATIFTNSSAPKLKVSDTIWLEGTSDLTLSALDSANIDKSNYDIWATKSSVNDGQKEVSANVALYDGSNFNLKSLSLKKIENSAGQGAESKNAESSTDSAKTTKNRVYLGNTSEGSDFTKLTLSENLKAQNLDSAEVELRGKSELKAQSIEFSSVKNSKLILDNKSKLTGANGNANIKVAGENSKLNIYFAGEKNFDINASGGSSVVILSVSEESQKIAQSGDSSPLAQNDNLSVDSAIQSTRFSGKISAQDSSIITTALETITASVDLKGSAKLEAKNITLDSANNTISLVGTSSLSADKISANNVSNFKLTQENSANLNVKNISLTNSTLQASALTFGAESSIITSDDKSKLEITNLKITNGNLTLNLADSAKNTQNLSTIDISNGGSVSFTNKWDFGGGTNFKSNGGAGRINFNDATYTHNGSAKIISADSAINGELSLLSVGKTSAQKAKKVDSAKSFETLKFEDKKLEFGSGATIKVTFDNAVKKGASDITLGTYYTLISASEITDNRSDKRIDFSFASGVSDGEKFFVVSKIEKDKLQVKFLNDNPKTFGELIKNIDKNYAEILSVLMEHNNNDESIDIATRTDDYGILNARLKGIDSAMNNIAQSHHTHTTRTLLSVNNNAIDTRITQVRLLASASARKRAPYFAYNDKMQRIMKLQNGGVASDAAPSYKVVESSQNTHPNDIWLNVGGGYFGGAQSVGFATTNIGYDRLINFEGGDVLVGGMLGFGVSKGAQRGSDGAQTLSESAQFYNLGFYTHSVFGASGGVFGGNELQGNVNFSIHNNTKIINSQSAQNTATGFLANIYYKYRFVLKSNETSLHALKPLALLGFGYNHSGAFSAGEYKVDALGDGALILGFGLEYNFVQSESYYSVAFIAQDRAFRTKSSASVSLNNAKRFIGYTITSAPSVDFTLNFNGAHHITSGFYVQYGIMGMMDSGANYGVKGDLKVGYRF